MMYDLRKSYNRQYYWNVFRIQARAKWRILRLNIAKQIIKLAFLISPDTKEAIESRMLKNPRREYRIFPR